MKLFYLMFNVSFTLAFWGLFFLGVSFPALAQIRPDRTLGRERSVVERNQRVNGRSADVITGGATRGKGNLFHSFEEFNVNNGQRVYFASPTGIENIFTRVTGNNPSRIRGLLGVDGVANLFLLNPRGIIFGDNAALDVRGSFLATTAESILFNDNAQFRADGTQTNSLLRVSVPVGLQFGRNPNAIINRSIHQLPENSVDSPISSDDPFVGLNVPAGETLALIGGDIFLDGGELTAPAGQIELGSVDQAGQVRLISAQQGWKFGYSGIQNFGDIQLSNVADVDASGVGGGAVHVRGDQVSVSDGSLIRANTLGDQNGIGIFIDASTVTLVGVERNNRGEPVTNAANQPFPSGLFARVSRNDDTDVAVSGRGGNISIATQQLSILDGAQVSTSSRSGVGNPPGVETTGRITVHAAEVELAGVVLLANGEPLLLDSGAPFPSALSTFTNSNRRAGDLTITTQRLRLRDGAVLQTTTQSSGRAGNLRIHATESIEVSGTAKGLAVPTGLLTFSGGIARTNIGVEPEADATGRSGNLDITTEELNIRDGAVVAVGSSNPEGMAGSAGTLRIQARSIQLNNQAQLTAATEDVNGGNINLQSQDVLVLRRNSNISASAGDNNTPGNGGNINIGTTLLLAVPFENSDITANAFEGAGGEVRIRANTIGIEAREQLTNLSDITAFSERGVSGVITIDSPDVEIRQEAIELPTAPVRTELAQGCQAEGGQVTASFVTTGRGGLSPNPYEPLSDSEILADLRLPNPLVEAKGWIRNGRGNITLIAEMPTTHAGCRLR